MTTSYTQIKVQELHQLVNKQMLFGITTISQLKNIVKYTNRIPNPYEPIDGPTSDQEEYKYYQRIKNGDRAYDIKLFFLKQIWNKYYYQEKRISPLGTLPSSLILSIDKHPDAKTLEEFTKYIAEEDKAKVRPDLTFLSDGQLYIPEVDHVFIVDGQHRIAGFDLLYEEAQKQDIEIRKGSRNEYYVKNLPPWEFIIEEIKGFQFLTTFLVDFDLYEQAEIFATVNFNQQKVNRSFYYDIFGSNITSKSIEKLLHDITSHMNFKEDSPLKGKIKMLGSGSGNFSQAFFVDAQIPLFKSGVFAFIYADFQKGGDLYKQFPKFLKAYFTEILKIFKNVDNDKSVLLKTTGMGALLRLMENVFRQLKLDFGTTTYTELLGLDTHKLEEGIKKIFEPAKHKGEVYFGEDSDYSKGSGKGLQTKLYKTIANDLGFVILRKSKLDSDDVFI